MGHWECNTHHFELHDDGWKKERGRRERGGESAMGVDATTTLCAKLLDTRAVTHGIRTIIMIVTMKMLMKIMEYGVLYSEGIFLV